MTTPKSPEQIMEELRKQFPGEIKHYGFGRNIKEELNDFLRSAMASLLCYMAERMPEHASSSLPLPPYKDNLKYKEIDGKSCITEVDGAYNAAIDDCRCILIQMADGIWKE